MMDARSGLEPMAAEKFLEGTQNLIDTHLRPAGHDAFIRLSAYFSDSERAKESMRAFSQFDVEGNGHISPKDFVKYITNLPLENAIAKADPTPKEVKAARVSFEEAIMMVKSLDTMSDGRIFWSTLGRNIELAAARQVALASLDDESDLKPQDIALDKTHWRDPNRAQAHWSIADISKNAVEFRFASLKALRAPLEDIDRAFLSQFISLMRRTGIEVKKHGQTSNRINLRKLRLNNKVTHLIWNSPRSQRSRNRRPAVMPLLDVVEVTRGAFPGSVAMRMGQVKRCIAICTPARGLFVECECEEDADLLFAGISILSLGNQSKKMADQRRIMKERHLEDELAKNFKPTIDLGDGPAVVSNSLHSHEAEASI